MAEEEITVDEGTEWSDLETSLETGVTVTDGATLTIDEKAEAFWIYVADGKLDIETMHGVDFEKPTLTLKDHKKAGIMVGKGTIGVVGELPEYTLPAVKGYEELLDEKLHEWPRAVIRNDFGIKRNSIEPAENKWFFLPVKLEWSLHKSHLLETYNTVPLITYWEEIKGERVQRVLTFEEGIWGVEREKETELHENTMDGGDKVRLTYDRTTEKAWNIGGIFNRRYEGKEKMRELYRLAGPLQRDTPLLFVCEDVITYMKIKNVEHEVEDNFFRWNMLIKEEDEAAADRIYTK